MFHRSLSTRVIGFAFLAVSLAAPPTGRAEALDLSLAAGAGAAVVVSDPCGYDDCAAPRLRHRGTAAFVGVIARQPWRGGSIPLTLDARLGGRAEAAVLGSGSGFATAVVELELGMAPLTVSGGLGLSWIWTNDDKRRDASVTTAFVTGGAIHFSPSLALAARAELHAFMHSPHAAAIAGVGLEWTPSP